MMQLLDGWLRYDIRLILYNFCTMLTFNIGTSQKWFGHFLPISIQDILRIINLMPKQVNFEAAKAICDMRFVPNFAASVTIMLKAFQS